MVEKKTGGYGRGDDYENISELLYQIHYAGKIWQLGKGLGGVPEMNFIF